MSEGRAPCALRPPSRRDRADVEFRFHRLRAIVAPASQAVLCDLGANRRIGRRLRRPGPPFRRRRRHRPPGDVAWPGGRGVRGAGRGRRRSHVAARTGAWTVVMEPFAGASVTGPIASRRSPPPPTSATTAISPIATPRIPMDLW